MPLRATPLTAAKVRTAKPGRYGDGDGLYLLVRDNGTAFWVFRYVLPRHNEATAGDQPQAKPKMREIGLGRARGQNAVSLADARTAAAPLHRLARNKVDPLEQRKAEADAARAATQAEKARAITFKTVAGHYIDAHEAGWRNSKHAAQWRATLTAYAYPHMGDLPVGRVGTAEVLAAVEPIWKAKPETASRVRGRIEALLDYAKTREWRSGENPAAWRGHLDNLLPARSKVAKVEHHAALPWQQINTFMAELRQQNGIAAHALEFAILTAGRTGEVIGARWSEIDMQQALWIVPPERMKAGREHRVPLCERALDLLREVAKLRTTASPDAIVFPGQRPGRGLSNMAMLVLLRRMGRSDLTAHGFRSTFSDWAAETGKASDIKEAALAHTLGDKTVAAYQRGDLLERRRELMDAWAAFIEKPTGEVVSLLRTVEVAA
jgi:integrase